MKTLTNILRYITIVVLCIGMLACNKDGEKDKEEETDTGPTKEEVMELLTQPWKWYLKDEVNCYVDYTYSFNANGTYVIQYDFLNEGSYTVSQEGKTLTLTYQESGKTRNAAFTIVSISQSSLQIKRDGNMTELVSTYFTCD